MSLGSKLFRSTSFRQILTLHTSSILNESPLKIKKVPSFEYVGKNKRSYKERLYVWGYSATGALGW
jgi:hypothetical protein